MVRSGWIPFWAMRSRVEIALWRWPTLSWWIRRWLRGSEFGFGGDDDDGRFWRERMEGLIEGKGSLEAEGTERPNMLAWASFQL